MNFLIFDIPYLSQSLSQHASWWCPVIRRKLSPDVFPDIIFIQERGPGPSRMLMSGKSISAPNLANLSGLASNIRRTGASKTHFPNIGQWPHPRVPPCPPVAQFRYGPELDGCPSMLAYRFRGWTQSEREIECCSCFGSADLVQEENNWLV